MPINKYFGGHGESVMKEMTKKHDSKKGKSIFYATAKKRGLEPSDSIKAKHGVK